ncbi:MAG: succinate dehydrogenase, cytochrome b556 subunit [Ignavibacteria bacterium]|nr:succinate dehydrogenase, cytochrome b556 subunit [Ignavibacteria bacterium]
MEEKKIKFFEQKNWIKENLSYYKDSGSWAWIYHRISGIALLLYIFMHIWSLSPLTSGKEAFEHKMAMYSTPVFSVIEWLLFAIVLFHSLNGIRIVLVDWADGARYHKKLYKLTWIVGIVLFLAMGFVMFSHEIFKLFR